MHWGRLAGPSRPLSNLFRPKNAAGGTRLSASGCHVRALIRWERCCFNVPWEVLNVGGAHSLFLALFTVQGERSIHAWARSGVAKLGFSWEANDVLKV